MPGFLPGPGPLIGLQEPFSSAPTSTAWVLPLTDTITTSDSIAKSLGISKGDSTTLSDSFGRVWTIVRTATDTLTTSDALGGKTISLGKADTITLSDFFSGVKGTGWLQSLSDTISLTDALLKAVTAAKADTTTTSDAIIKNVGSNKADTTTTSDALSKAVTHPLTDTTTTSDAISKQPRLVKLDTLTTSDALAKLVGLNKLDSTTMSDAVAKAIAHKLADSFTTSDVFTPNLIPGGGTAWTLNLSDTLTTADALFRTLSNAGASTSTAAAARKIFLSRFGIY